jgi:hypothetical protein
MTAPLLALSLSNTLLKIGALAAFAGLVGIAVLSLLVFSQAREIKRLREWAGRAPERAAELEQRVSADATARVQRVVQPRAGVGVGGAPVPRATPVVTRATAAAGAVGQATPAIPGQAAVSPAGQAAAIPAGQVAASPAGQAAGVPAGQVAAVPAGQAAAVTAGQAPAGTAGQPAAGGAPGGSAPGVAPQIPATVAASGGASAPVGGEDAPSSTDSSPPGLPSTDSSAPGQPPAARPAGAAAPPLPVPGQPAFVPTAQPGGAAQAPVAGGESERTAGEEAPAAVKREEQLVPAAAAAVAAGSKVAHGATALSEAAESPVAGVSAPATAAARAAGAPARSPVAPTPARAVAAPRAARPAAPPRPGAAPPRGAPGQPPAGAGASRPAAARGGGRVQGPPFLQEERSPGRTTALIVGGVVFGVAVLVGVLLSFGGGGSSNKGTGATTERSASSGRHAGRARRAHAPAATVSPGETRVVVLNGTETTGLAHRISTNLQQSGYTQSTALDSRPGGRAASVVEYAEGHRTEAQHVSQTLGIAQVQTLEGAVAPLVGTATVVVIAGADQAALGGEG